MGPEILKGGGAWFFGARGAGRGARGAKWDNLQSRQQKNIGWILGGVGGMSVRAWPAI